MRWASPTGPPDPRRRRVIAAEDLPIPTLRRATSHDAGPAAELVLSAAPSIEAVLGDRTVALRAIGAAFRSDRTVFGHRWGLVAERKEPMGLVIAFPGRLFGSLTLGTQVVLGRAVGARHAAGLVRRSRALKRLLPPVGSDTLYVSMLAVAPEHRGRGIGRGLMERVIAGAERLGLGVTVDVGAANAPGRRLYERLGFRAVDETRLGPADQNVIPTSGSLRMELR